MHNANLFFFLVCVGKNIWKEHLGHTKKKPYMMENKKKEKKKKYVTALDATFPISPGDGVGGRIIGKRFNRCLRDSALLALRCPVSFTHLLSIPRDFVGGGYHQVHFEHPLLPPIPSNGFFDGKAFHPLFHSGPNISSDEPRTIWTFFIFNCLTWHITYCVSVHRMSCKLLQQTNKKKTKMLNQNIKSKKKK